MIASHDDQRWISALLVLAPTTRDAAHHRVGCSDRPGIDTDRVPSLDELLARTRRRARRRCSSRRKLATSEDAARWPMCWRDQPPWSDLPVLVLTRPGADSPESAEAVRTLGNVTLLERPVRVATLVERGRRPRCARASGSTRFAATSPSARATEAGAARRRSAQGRVPRDARPRAAQPARAAPDRPRAAEACRASTMPRALQACAVMERQVNHLVRLVDDLLEVSRITRGMIDVQQGAGRPDAIVRAADRDQPAAARRRRTPADRRSPGRADRGRRRSGAADAGVRQPADQRRQVHEHRRDDRAHARAARAATARGLRQRQRHRHPAGAAVVGLRHVHAGRSIDRRAQGGLGIGLTLVRSLVRCTAAPSRRAARDRARAASSSSAAARSAETRRAPATRRRSSRCRRAASWSSTTTTTPPRASAMLLRALGATVAAGAQRPRQRSSAVDDFTPGRRAARHRHARHGRLRSGAADPRQVRHTRTCR